MIFYKMATDQEITKMQLQLDKEYTITSDKRQYVLNQAYKDDRLLVAGYYTSLEILLKDYIGIKTRTQKGIKTAQELLDYFNQLITSLNKALEPLKFEVIKKV